MRSDSRSRSNRRTAVWALAALLGIVLTAGITWATSQLTSQRIGLSSEPLAAGRALAPRSPVGKRPAHGARRGSAGATGRTTTAKPRTSTPSAPSSTVTAAPQAGVRSTPSAEEASPSAPAESAPAESAPAAPAEQAQPQRTSTFSGGDGGDSGHGGGQGGGGQSGGGRDD
ncbi:MAG TPA: hypothetical protein VES65_08990 [Solirubrobacteraceae bacterium]|nr:hypothetical protein [Solirubrobacteraceae bacterium]